MIKSPGQVAFEAYFGATQRTIPPWDACEQHVREAWEEAAKAGSTFVFEDAYEDADLVVRREGDHLVIELMDGHRRQRSARWRAVLQPTQIAVDIENGAPLIHSEQAKR